MPINLTATAFAALLLNGAVLGVIALGGAIFFGRRSPTADRWIAGALTVALSGYGVFWCGFVHPAAARIAAWLVLGAAAAVIARRPHEARDCLQGIAPVALGTTLFTFAATAVLLLHPGASIADTAQRRFFDMPGDNDLPRLFAQLIADNILTPVLGGGWLTSDRPPLQSGVALLTWPALEVCRVDFGSACATAGIWFQALWFPAVWSLLRALGLRARAAAGVTAAMSATGFLMFNTVYVWPKLAAASFVVIAFLLWFSRADSESHAPPLRLGAACAACGWLAHGGVFFSLVALAPLILVDAWRPSAWRPWLGAAAVFLVIAAPWLLYQKFYAPPGNRLVKWHIAGVVEPDARGVMQTLSDQYRKTGWRGAWDARRQNFRMLFDGHWLEPFDPRAERIARQTGDVAFPLRTAAAWSLGLLALPWALLRRRQEERAAGRLNLLAALWLIGGLLAWVALMFSANSVFTHQGSYVTQLLLLSLLAAWARRAGLIFFLGVAAVQWIGFIATWLAPAPGWHVSTDALATWVAIGSGAALAALAAWWSCDQKKSPATLEPRAEIRPTQASLHSHHA